MGLKQSTEQLPTLFLGAREVHCVSTTEARNQHPCWPVQSQAQRKDALPSCYRNQHSEEHATSLLAGFQGEADTERRHGYVRKAQLQPGMERFHRMHSHSMFDAQP